MFIYNNSMNKDYVMDIRKKLKSHDLIMVPSAAIVPFDGEKVILQRRSDTGTWGVFGGGINYDESIKETAIRELFEESNFNAINLKEFGIYSKFPIKYSNGDVVNAFTIAFVCGVKNKDDFKNNDNETLEVGIFTKKDIETLEFWNETSKEIVEDAFEYKKNKKFILK